MPRIIEAPKLRDAGIARLVARLSATSGCYRSRGAVLASSRCRTEIRMEMVNRREKWRQPTTASFMADFRQFDPQYGTANSGPDCVKTLAMQCCAEYDIGIS
jgi:hypothetical protein